MDAGASFHASSLTSEDATRILTDDVALEQARIFRRLFVMRFGLLAIVAFVVARLIPGLSVYAHWVPVAMFATPPVWAWLWEIKLALRVSARRAAAEDRKS